MMKKLAVGSLVTALSFVTIPAAQAVTLDPHAVPARTQITVRHDSGATVSTANAHESRPALSLSKLYLGYWVLKYGAPADKARVEHMIRVSDDNVATDGSPLPAGHPQYHPRVRSARNSLHWLLGNDHYFHRGRSAIYLAYPARSHCRTHSDRHG